MLDCHICPKKGSAYHHQSHFKSFPAIVRLEFVTIDIAGPSPNPSQDNQLVVVNIHCYSKLTNAIPKVKVAVPHVAPVFFDPWAISYSIADRLLSDSGAQFESQFSSSPCTFLEMKNDPTITYIPQSNGHTESFNRTLLTRFR